MSGGQPEVQMKSSDESTLLQTSFGSDQYTDGCSEP